MIFDTDICHTALMTPLFHISNRQVLGERGEQQLEATGLFGQRADREQFHWMGREV